MIQSAVSSKQGLLGRDGFLLTLNTQSRYRFGWHEHDCPMLLWSRAGDLRCHWLEPDGRQAPQTSSLVLSPGMALLLPASTVHASQAGGRHQQHGQLYLAPSLLRDTGVGGAVWLDLPARQMLEALCQPALAPRAAPVLLRALLEQITACPVLPARQETMALSMPQRMLRIFAHSLAEGERPAGLQATAASMGVSVRSLQRQCLQELGSSPAQLRRQLLAQEVRRRLAAGDSLVQISLALGFASSGHVGRLLRACGPSH